MTIEEVGAYALLPCMAWRENPPGSIPDDGRVLARRKRLAPDRWKKFRSARTPGGIRNGCVGSMRNSGASNKAVESAKQAAHARYESINASRIRNACESEAPRIRDECLSFSYSNTTKEEKDITADSMEQLFTEFWEAYPKKEVPNKAKREFQKLNPDRKLLIRILDWLKDAKLSKQWQCVELTPLPATFLAQRYWEGNPPRAVNLCDDRSICHLMHQN